VGCAASAHAAVVVEHGDGRVLSHCVEMGGTTKADAILSASGIEVRYIDYGGSLGHAVCQIDYEPQSYPATCFTASSPYWTFFIDQGSGWRVSPGGVSNTDIHDGWAIGFRYNPQSGGGGAPPSAAGVCSAATSPSPITNLPAGPPPAAPAPDRGAPGNPTAGAPVAHGSDGNSSSTIAPATSAGAPPGDGAAATASPGGAVAPAPSISAPTPSGQTVVGSLIPPPPAPSRVPVGPLLATGVGGGLLGLLILQVLRPRLHGR